MVLIFFSAFKCAVFKMLAADKLLWIYRLRVVYSSGWVPPLWKTLVHETRQIKKLQEGEQAALQGEILCKKTRERQGDRLDLDVTGFLSFRSPPVQGQSLHSPEREGKVIPPLGDKEKPISNLQQAIESRKA